MIIPITVGQGQEIEYTLEYYNAFQQRDFEWDGKVFSADTDILKMLIIFPEDKPFKSFETYKKATSATDKIKIGNPNVQPGQGNHTLTWTIENARKGEKYYIKWLW